jgi:hypothetical protein
MAMLPGIVGGAVRGHAVTPDWPAIRAELENVKSSDQTLRNEYSKMLTDARAKGIEVDPAARKEILARIDAQDAENQRRVFALIDQHGWPPQSKVGPDAAIAAFLVVQHAALADQQKYLGRYRDAVAAGEASKSNLALLEDRILIREGKKQRYGTQADTKNGVSILPTEDEDNLDARRKDMGLPPICDYLKYFVKQHGNVTYSKCLPKGESK